MSLIYGLLAISLLITLHWGSQFLLTSMGALTRVLIIFLLGISTIVLLHVAFETPLEETLSATIWFAFFCELYVFLFTLSLSSISVKILHLLKQRPMTYAEVQTLYQPDSMVEKRFERLAIAGLIHHEGVDLRLTPKGKRLVFVFNTIRNVLHHKGGER